MHDGWEIAVRREAGPERRRVLTRRERMYVSLNKRGEIVMNGRAFAEIGTWHVTLMYRPPTEEDLGDHPLHIRGTIAVKRPVPKDVHYFPVHEYGRGLRMRIVRAAKLLKQFGIKIEGTRVFEDIWVEMFEGEPMLMLDLASTSEL
jgi:hypothetical protein